MAGSAPPVSKGKRPLRALSASDKIEAIQRVNDGESKASVARQIGVPESTLRGWCKNEDKLRYMSSRHSTPDTDKSDDDMNNPAAKRPKYDHLASPDSQSLDLSRLKEQPPVPVAVAAPPLNDDESKAVDPGAKISMSAISPLSTLNHLGQSHLGMSFNEIATNLSLIAQMNPSLSSIANSINSSAKILRSIRSPKPTPNGSSSSSLPVNLSDKQQQPQQQQHIKSERKSSYNPTRSSYKDHPVDDALWYWFKNQQAMMNLGQQLPAISLNGRSSKASTMAPVVPPLDKNSWFWQYYKQFTSNLGLHEDKSKSMTTAIKPDSHDILYSQLMKEEKRLQSPPEVQKEVEECNSSDQKNQVKARAVLDNLLLLNNNNVPPKKEDTPPPIDDKDSSNAENEFGCEVSEALEHGEKFLKWLEACQEPSVTRMQVHQLKGLLNNIKANAVKRNQDSNNKDRISRRK